MGEQDPFVRRQLRLHVFQHHIRPRSTLPFGWVGWDRSAARQLSAAADRCSNQAGAGGTWTEVLNTDAHHYGGSGVGNLGEVHAQDVPWHGMAASAALRVPPLGALWLRMS
ncbi:alpha amylase C-terminal domain-containing protein [Micromonospora zamorensis]|nr:alpha amylase C-terminal domain-containing protein [Micromonospora zamorensis]